MMMLTYCEAPYGNHKQVMNEVKLRIKRVPETSLMEALEFGILDDKVTLYQLKEDDLFSLDNPLLIHLRSQLLIAAELVLLSIDNSAEVTVLRIESKRLVFSGGQSHGGFPSEIFKYIDIVDNFRLFKDMGAKTYKYLPYKPNV